MLGLVRCKVFPWCHLLYIYLKLCCIIKLWAHCLSRQLECWTGWMASNCPLVTGCFGEWPWLGLVCHSWSHWMSLELIQENRNKHKSYYSKINTNLNDLARIFFGQHPVTALMSKQQPRSNRDYNSHSTRTLRMQTGCFKLCQHQ